MKTFFREFLKRGLFSACGGPMILAAIYYFIGKSGKVESLSPTEVALGIISITVMAFIAGGISAIYKNDKLPVATSALIHAGVLYLDYLMIYLINDWIPRNGTAIGIFSAIFFISFAVIWLIIFIHIRKKTESINKLRLQKE